MACPDYNQCDRKVCLELGICGNSAYWSKYWESRLPPPRAISKRKNANWSWERFKHLHVDDRLITYHSRICSRFRPKCSKIRTCGILGQCLYDHQLVKGDLEAIAELKPLTSVKSINKILRKLKQNRTGNGYPE